MNRVAALQIIRESGTCTKLIEIYDGLSPAAQSEILQVMAKLACRKDINLHGLGWQGAFELTMKILALGVIQAGGLPEHINTPDDVIMILTS